MEITLWPIAKLRPYPNNPRRNDDGVEAVAASLREFGFRQPIVVDAEGVIVCGHTRYEAAQSLGLEHVPVHVAKDQSPEQSLGRLYLRFKCEPITTHGSCVRTGNTACLMVLQLSIES